MKGVLKKCWLFLLITLLFAVFPVTKSRAVEITIALPTGRILASNFNPEETINDIKEYVYNVSSISPENQRIFKDFEELENNRSLSSYTITDGDTLYVKFGTGGMSRDTKKSGGFFKILIIIVILAGIFIFVKKIVLKKPVEE